MEETQMRAVVLFAVFAGALLASPIAAWGGGPATDAPPSIVVPRVKQRPTIDQFLRALEDSEFSSPLLRVQGLRQRVPSDGAPVSERTDVYLGYDDHNLYFIFVCFDRKAALIRSQLVRRDQIPNDDDNVAINLDTFRDQKHAYGFSINAAGVQLDGLFSESDGWDFSYDMVWSSDARLTPKGYIALIAIPFNSLRFPTHGGDGWGLLLYRGIPRNNEDAYWPQYSKTIAGRLLQAGVLRGIENVAPSGNMQFVPYGSFLGGRSLDLRDPSMPHFASQIKPSGGLDSKFILHNSIVIDSTINPDFSQVESDQPQETLNQRFEVFFPELRPFFLENASYFSTPLNLVFTRRIADPQFGSRITGRIGHYALGVLASDDRSPGEIVAPSSPLNGERALFGAVRIARDIGGNGSLGVIFTSRTDSQTSNYVGGVDGRFTLASSWVASGQVVASHTDEQGHHADGVAYEATVLRSGTKLNYQFRYDDRSPGFRADLGFINRVDIREVANTLSYRFRPEGKWVTDWGPDLATDQIWDHHGLAVGAIYTPRLTLDMARGTTLSVFHSFAEETLRPGDFGTLPANRTFDEGQTGVTFATSLFARWTASGGISTGRGINFLPPPGVAPQSALVQSATAALSVRMTRALTFDGSYILTRLRDPRTGAADLNEHIVRAKWNYQFTRAMSLRTILQYHSLLANAARVSPDSTKQVTADVLFTYSPHPYTALYVGYTHDLENIDPALLVGSNGLVRTRNSFLNDGRQVFVKVSYLFRR
jgi:hypothetical protein